MMILPLISLFFLSISSVQVQWQITQNTGHYSSFVLLILLMTILFMIVIRVETLLANSIIQSLKKQENIAQRLSTEQFAIPIEPAVERDLEPLSQAFEQIQNRLNHYQPTITAYQQFLQEIKRIFVALSQGDFTQTMNQTYPEELTAIQTQINDSIKNLDQLAHDFIAATAQKALTNEVRFTGFFKALGIQLEANQTAHQQFIPALESILVALLKGDFTQTLSINEAEDSLELQKAVNTLVQEMNQFFAEVQDVIEASHQGHWDRRMDLKNKMGEFKRFSQNINKSIENHQMMLEEVKRAFVDLSKGDFGPHLNPAAQEKISQLKQGLNTGSDSLQQLILELQEVTRAAAQGFLNQRVDVSNKSGLFQLIGENLNHTLNYYQKIFEELLHLFGKLSEGDLTGTLTGHYSQVLEKLKEEVNQTLAQWYTVITNLTQAIEEVNQGIQGMNQHQQVLSQSIQEQNDVLTETISHLQTLVKPFEQHVEQSQQIHQLSLETEQLTKQGEQYRATTSTVLTEMSQIHQKMNHFIKIMDEIAFQTHLVALNTGFEATRMGQQGPHLAEVATHIRQLAQRSQTMVQEIKVLMPTHRHQVEQGTEQVHQWSQILEQIRASIHKVIDQVDQVKIMVQQQFTDIFQINHKLNQLNEITPQNKTLVTEMMAMHEALTQKIVSLKALSEFFKLEDKSQSTNSTSPTESSSSAKKQSSISFMLINEMFSN